MNLSEDYNQNLCEFLTGKILESDAPIWAKETAKELNLLNRCDRTVSLITDYVEDLNLKELMREFLS